MKYIDWILFSKKILNEYNKNIYLSEEILKLVINKSTEFIHMNENKVINYSYIEKLNKILIETIKGKPIEYIKKKKEFWSMKFKINSLVFIPRKETELLVEFIINYVNDNKKYNILDLGSGCGSISISLSNEIKNSFINGVDINKDAIKLSNINLKRLSKYNNVLFFYSNWFKNINNYYDIIVSNPPYMSLNEFNNSKYNILFDPIDSIISNNSLYNFFKIIKNSRKFLYKNGLIILEHSELQTKSINKILIKFNFKNIKTYKDYNSLNRFSIGFT